MKRNVLAEKSFAFAIRVIRFCKDLRLEESDRILAKQLLRSGTSIGASIREASRAETKKDFIHKLSISLKEAEESLYWLEIFRAVTIGEEITTSEMLLDCSELIRLLTSSIKTAKEVVT